MEIYVVRHGEAAASWESSPDPDLSDLGRSQALAATEELLTEVPKTIDIVSSPLQRAQQTAAPLLEALGGDLHINTSFIEIPSPVPLSERKQWLIEFMQQKWHEQDEAVLIWRENIISELKLLKRPTVIFSHFLVLNAIVSYIQEKQETFCFKPDNASITKLKLINGELSITQLGRELTSNIL